MDATLTLKDLEPVPALRGRAPVPETFRGWTLTQLPEGRVRDTIQEYGAQAWTHVQAGLAPLLLGPAGTYKSAGAAVLAQALHERLGLRTAWCNVPVDLAAWERQRFEASTDQAIAHLRTVPYLVLDDACVLPVGSWGHGVLREVLCARYDQRRPTCLTGNLAVSGQAPTTAFVEALGAQVARRVLERAQGFRVLLRR